MTDVIVTGLFTLGGVALGGFFSFLISLDSKERSHLKLMNQKLRYDNDLLVADIQKMGNHIIAYWNLEKIYADEISKSVGKPIPTILKEHRQIIENSGYTRPTMTENDVNDILGKHTHGTI